MTLAKHSSCLSLPSWSTTLVLSTAGLCCLIAFGGIVVGPTTSSSSSRSCRRRKHDNDKTHNDNKDNDKKHHRNHRRTLQDELNDNGGGNSITLQPIGVVRSVYSLCVGTPRQGLLATAARGRVELHHDSAKHAVEGLMPGYSHVWIIFWFHLNTAGRKKNKTPSKIAPPAAGGRRVGVYGTRSPHRPNPIGLSLVRLDGITTEKRNVNNNNNNKKKKPQWVTILHISGLDLVDGTPVLDIKPHVPVYDTTVTTTTTTTTCRVPSWVADGLNTMRTVTWTDTAGQNLREIMAQYALQFYADNEIDVVQQAIDQVLGMDVRSVYQTRKARQGGFQAQRSHRIITTTTSTANHSNSMEKDRDGINDNDNKTIHNNVNTNNTQQLDNLLIHYTVIPTTDAQRPQSIGSGAEDVVQITSIQYLPPPLSTLTIESS